MTADPSRRPAFPTTRITLIEAARDESSPRSREALAALCAAYWFPIYAYIRRLGHPPADAEDLTQGFFARLLEKHDLRSFARERGRFRSFLLAAAKHFVANERDRARAAKRGGGVPAVPFDDALGSGERRLQLEPRDDLTPEKLFERQWALALLQRVEERLAAEAEAQGRRAQFDCLKASLAPGEPTTPYAEIARALSTTEGAVKVAVHRLRRRFKELIREEIAETVADPGEVGDELSRLMAALRL